MSYEKYYPGGWQSGETGGTPITPEALNHMEDGIVNSAPSGFGLGNIVDIKAEDLNSTFQNGWYRIAGQSLTVGGYTSSDWYAHVSRYSSKYCIQELYPFNRTYKLIRRCVNGTWYESWENPPMVPGTAYRTSKMWDNKAVYTKAVDVGAIEGGGVVEGVGAIVTSYSKPLNVKITTLTDLKLLAKDANGKQYVLGSSACIDGLSATVRGSTISNTTIDITNSSGRSFTSCVAVLEYTAD